MTCTMKRKFEEVEHEAHSCLKTLTGYEKCLLQKKLLHARFKIKTYENLINSYEAQMSVAQLDVEVATSDIDLLLQELQTGKRYKVGFSNKNSVSTTTQTDPQLFSPRSPPRISFNLPSGDLSSFTTKTTDNLQESDTIQREKAPEPSTNLEENAPELGASLGVNAQQLSASKEAFIHKPATNQSSKDSGYISPENLLKKSTTRKYKLNKDGNSRDNVRSNSAGKAKRVNEKNILLSSDKTQKKKDESKSVSPDRRSYVNKYFDLCDSPKHIEKANERKSRKEKCDDNGVDNKQKRRPRLESQNIEPKDIENKKSSGIQKGDKINQDKAAKKNSDKAYNQSDRPQKKSEPQRSNLNRRKNDDSKMKKDELIKDEISSNTDNNKSRKSLKKSEPEQKPKLNRRDKNNANTDKHLLNKVKCESQIEDRSNDTTLLLAKDIKKIETLPNLRTDDFAPHYIQYTHDSPILYSDFVTNIMSSVNTSYTTSDVPSFENTVAQSTPLKRSGSEYQANPDSAKVLWSDTPKEDQLTTFIKITLADYNRDMADLAPETITYKDIIKNDINTTYTNFKTVEIPNEKTTSSKTIKINDKTYSKQTYDDNEKKNYNNSSKTDIIPKTPEIMNKNLTKQNVMVQIPITRVPDAINFKDPTKKPETKLPVTINQKNAIVKRPCLTISVNDAGVITIRSEENSNPPSPKIAHTVAESQVVVNSTTLSDLQEQNNTHALDTLLINTVQNTKIVENPIESASTRLKNQYYFDIDSPIYNSPREADEAPNHKLGVNLSHAFSLLMPPSPTYTVPTSPDKEKSNKRSTPSPPKANELSINKKLLNNFVPNTFYSHINCTEAANSDNKIYTNRKINDTKDNTLNENSNSHRCTINSSQNPLNNIKNNRNYIINNRSDIAIGRNDINSNRSDIANNKSDNMCKRSNIIKNRSVIIANNISDIKNKSSAITNKSSEITNKRIDITNNTSFISNNKSNLTNNKSSINNNKNDITINRSDINNNRNDITINRSDINNNRNYINNNKNDITDNKNCSYTKPMPIRRTKSTPDTTLRRTIQLITALPLKVQRTKSTSTNNNMSKDKRRKSMDEQKILRILKEQGNSISNECSSPRCDVTSSKKKDLDNSSDRLVYGLYQDLRRARCRDYVTNKSTLRDYVTNESKPSDYVTNKSIPRDYVTNKSIPRDYVTNKSIPRDYDTNKSIPRDYVTNKSIPRDYVTNESKHTCMYCGPVNEGHLCFYLLKTILEQC